MPSWMKLKLESRWPGEVSVTSDMQMIPPYGRRWKGTEEPLDESARGEWKSWLKTVCWTLWERERVGWLGEWHWNMYNIIYEMTKKKTLNFQKTKIMTSSPITSWQIDGEVMETVTDFIFMGSKTTADGDCSHEIKRHLLLGRKAMTKIDNILKSRDITLLTKVHLVKARVFPVVMYGCESWTIKKA